MGAQLMQHYPADIVRRFWALVDKNDNADIVRRFWALVDKNDKVGCWSWLGYKATGGYGRFKLRHNERIMAHRFSYELVKGAIPEGQTIDHLCRNPSCVNPAHLGVVSQKVNNLRGFGASGINARKTHCKNGHELTEDNLVLCYLVKGKRTCKICWSQYRHDRHASARRTERP